MAGDHPGISFKVMPKRLKQRAAREECCGDVCIIIVPGSPGERDKMRDARLRERSKEAQEDHCILDH